MSVVNWQYGSLETTPSVDGEPGASATWMQIDIPKETTMKLTSTAGTEYEAKDETGQVIDRRTAKNTYKLEFDLFLKKGVARPFTDDDGVISGEHAFRYTPADDTCEGFQIDRSSVYVEESYSVEEGTLLHYVVNCLKPKTGKTLKPYTKTAAVGS